MKPEPVPAKMSEEAALWVAKLEHGLTAPDQDQFLEWLTADPRHGTELSRQKQSWKRLDLLADWRPEHTAQPNRDLLAPREVKPAARSRSLVFWLGFSAAAALAAGLFIDLTPPAVPLAPARIAAIEQRTLDDGSVIELNRGADVSVLYTATERRVQLTQGEANFSVAKNAERPFIVMAGGVEVRAVGTAFNVRLAAASVEVLVTEGKVQLEPPATGGSTAPAPTFVAEGERAVVPLAVAMIPQVTAVTPAQADQDLAWQPKWLDFTETPLQAVVQEFNRRNAPIRMVVADPALSDTVVSASLRSDNIENFLRLLDGTFGVRVERAGNTITLHKARRE